MTDTHDTTREHDAQTSQGTIDTTPMRELHIADDDGGTLAVGAEFPSGTIIVEWNREAFPPGQQTTRRVTSRYETVADAEQASGGTVIYTEGTR